MPTCTFIKTNGAACRRNIAEGEGRCWQHAKTWKHKYRSLTTSQSAGFHLGVIGILVTLVLGVPPLYQRWMDKRHVSEISPAPPLPLIQVSFNAHLDPDLLPITVPVGSIGYVFFLNKVLNERLRQVSFYEIHNFSGDDSKQWPDPQIVKEERRKGDEGIVALRVDVKNPRAR